MRERAAWLLAAALIACRSQPQQLKPRDLITISPTTGAVSAKLVPDPNSPELKLGPGEEYVAPQLSTNNRPPKYPADLLPLNLPRHAASVRVTFDENDRAIEVVPSPVGEITHDSYESAFMSAVEDAVRNWHCYAARIRKFRDGPGYRIMTAQRILKTFFDVTFTFEVVNGHPVVRGGS